MIFANRAALLLTVLALAACDRQDASTNNSSAQNQATDNQTFETVPPNEDVNEAPLQPTPVGNAADRTPVSEVSFTPESAQGAGDVMQNYFALIESGRFAQAYALWGNGGRASGMSQNDFAKSFSVYREVHGQVGAPGQIEGAAGSLYVTVPIGLYGRVASGEAFDRKGTATLRRVDDVPGSTAEQRKWHIEKIDFNKVAMQK
jgi:hypothetical protein